MIWFAGDTLGIGCPHSNNIVRCNRALKAFERQFTDVRCIDFRFEFCKSTWRYQNLSVGRLAAQPGGEIADCTDCAVVQPIFKADRANRGVSPGDASAKPERVASLLPADSKCCD